MLEPMDTKKNTGVPFSLRPFLNNGQLTRMPAEPEWGIRPLTAFFVATGGAWRRPKILQASCVILEDQSQETRKKPGGAVEVRQASNPNAKSKPAASKIMKSAGVEFCFKTLLDPG